MDLPCAARPVGPLARALRVCGLSLAFGGFALTLAPQQAHACSCMFIDTATDAADHAAAVFEGRVLSANDKNQPSPAGRILSSDLIDYKVQVLQTWKGAPRPGRTVLVRSARSSASCGRGYEIGGDYLFYTYGAGHGDYRDSTCTRTTKSSRAYKDMQELGPADDHWSESRRPKPPPPPPPEPAPQAFPEPEHQYERDLDLALGLIDEEQYEATPVPEGVGAGPPVLPPYPGGCTLQRARSPSAWLWLLPALAWMRRRR